MFSLWTLLLLVATVGSQNINFRTKVPFKPSKIYKLALGEIATINCPTKGFKAIQITWSSLSQAPLPYHIRNVKGKFAISGFKESDKGLYLCTANPGNWSNAVDFWVELRKIEVFIPRFNGSQLIRISFDQSGIDLFSFCITFKPEASLQDYSGNPENLNGTIMIIRSSHSNRSGLIIGLIQGLMTAELFDEEKTSVVQFPQCLDSWEWQTACLNLTSDTVSLQINQERPESQLISRSLKILMSDLTIGGFPDLPRISNSKLSEQHQNYTGCIGRITINDELINIPKSKLTLQSCQVCHSNQCLNGGSCQAAYNRWGFRCRCEQSYRGRFCESRQFQSNNVGRSDKGIRFAKNSYLEILRPHNISNYDFSAAVMLKPDEAVMDSLILYATDKHPGVSDFVAIVIKDFHFELLFDCGSGLVRLQDTIRVVPGIWFEVDIKVKFGVGEISVFNQTLTSRQTNTEPLGFNRQLNLNTNFLIGGQSSYGLHLSVRKIRSFEGCISSPIRINEEPIDLWKSAIDYKNVGECEANRNWSQAPSCNNNTYDSGRSLINNEAATASENTTDWEEPQCPHSQCRNGGTCMISDGQPICVCAAGFTGPQCDTSEYVSNSAQFALGSYMEFPRKQLKQSGKLATMMINMTISTRISDGLIFWLGKSDSDYMSLALVDGQLELSVSLGLYPIHRVARQNISDDREHSIVAFLEKGSAVLMVDDYSSDTEGRKADMQSGTLKYLNTKENIFIGGVRNEGNEDQNDHLSFRGCIRNLFFNNVKVKFTEALVKFGDITTCQ